MALLGLVSADYDIRVYMQEKEFVIADRWKHKDS